jgi:hypothetical protein
MSDPLLVEGVDVSATLSLADRVAALRAWEESWNAFTGGHDGNAGVFWQKRRPNLRIALPASPSAQIKYILATIIDPGPPGSEQEEDWQHDTDDLCSFEPWFITGDGDGNPGTDYDRVHWTVIKVPVRNVLVIALSTELDLALVISCVLLF